MEIKGFKLKTAIFKTKKTVIIFKVFGFYKNLTSLQHKPTAKCRVSIYRNINNIPT